jgi:hypothetical protein
MMRKRKSNKTKGVLEQERLLQETLKRVGFKGGRKKSPYSIPCYKVDNPYKLSNSICGHGSMKPKNVNVYTGDEIMGIAVTHKSNLVPVRRGTDEAKQISRMSK